MFVYFLPERNIFPSQTGSQSGYPHPVNKQTKTKQRKLAVKKWL